MNIEQALTIFAIVGANIGTVIALYIQTDKKIEANRLETNNSLKEFRHETTSLIAAIREDIKEFHREMRNFHGRVSVLEERGEK